MTVTRSYSAGVLGHPVEDLAGLGLVAFGVTNSPPNIAPWGGTKPLFGTSPMAFAAPRREGSPLVIDQATSVVTKVALRARADAGEALPEGWALDAGGQPTTDPQAALAGSLLPFGGAKGGALALMIELLSAGLTGAHFSKDASPYAKADGPPPGVGQFFTVWDPAAFDAGFPGRIEELFAAMLAQDGVRLPGDRRLAARSRTLHAGVEVDDDIYLGLHNLEVLSKSNVEAKGVI
jgi:(2R)-3-sulfolactate dehydrogenase (NADP+)